MWGVTLQLSAGHAGTDVAIYSSKFLHKNVVGSAAYKVPLHQGARVHAFRCSAHAPASQLGPGSQSQSIQV